MTALRITGGHLRGRRLSGVASEHCRPTSSRVREAMFSILQSRGALQDAVVLDLFAGTGALGFEALSRGAAWTTFIDHNNAALSRIRADAETFGVAAQCKSVRVDLGQALSGRVAWTEHPATTVLMDPPYANAALIVPLLEALRSVEAVAEDALIAVETSAKETLTLPESISEDRTYRYGDTQVTILRFEP